jgi:hypothetical protein
MLLNELTYVCFVFFWSRFSNDKNLDYRAVLPTRWFRDDSRRQSVVVVPESSRTAAALRSKRSTVSPDYTREGGSIPLNVHPGRSLTKPATAHHHNLKPTPTRIVDSGSQAILLLVRALTEERGFWCLYERILLQMRSNMCLVGY